MEISCFQQAIDGRQHHTFPKQNRSFAGELLPDFSLSVDGDFSQSKLKAGVRLKDHIMQYGDRPNDFENVSRCE